VEAEREKERQHKAEMMRKTLMMEQHQRAIRKLEQARTNPWNLYSYPLILLNFEEEISCSDVLVSVCFVFVQRREDQLARREAEEAEKKRAEERAKVGLVPCTLDPWP